MSAPTARIMTLAMRCLQVLAAEPRGLTVAQLAQRCGVTKDSAARMLTAMEAAGWPLKRWKVGAQKQRVALDEPRVDQLGRLYVRLIGTAANSDVVVKQTA